jgi:hypothetical protein
MGLEPLPKNVFYFTLQNSVFFFHYKLALSQFTFGMAGASFGRKALDNSELLVDITQ